MAIFSNEKFNQRVKALSFAYIKKLLKVYTDKRGKDYQDIKKFVSSVFVDLNFLKPKEVVELFKTRRKKKITSTLKPFTCSNPNTLMEQGHIFSIPTGHLTPT